LENNVYTCIDIGNYEIKLLVCHIREERLFVLSQKTIKSMGIERGQITNFDKLVDQIKKIKEQAESDLKKPLKKLTLSLPPISVAVESVAGKINLDVNHQVGSKDVRYLFRQVMEQPHADAYLPVGLIPRIFRIDESQVVQNPRGLTGMNMGIEAQRILAPTTLVSNLVHVVESAGFRVEEIAVGSISETLLTLTTPETFARTCHINIGHTVTTVTVVNDGKIIHSRSSSIGGRDISRAIAEKFKISEKVADELKVKYGKILIHEADVMDNQVIYIDHTQKEMNYITRGMINSIITDWTVKLFAAVRDHITGNLRLKEEEYHYSLAGGMAELPNIIYALKTVFASQKNLVLQRPTMLGVRDSKFFGLVGVAIFAHELNLLLGSKVEEKSVEEKEIPVDEEEILEADILNNFIPLNEKISPTMSSVPSDDIIKPQSLKEAIAGMSVPNAAAKSKPHPKIEYVGVEEEATIRIPTVGSSIVGSPIADSTTAKVKIVGEDINDLDDDFSDDYIDEKLGSSGVLVRFLDKIFNENEEEA